MELENYENNIRHIEQSVIKLDKSAWDMIADFTDGKYDWITITLYLPYDETIEYSDFNKAFSNLVENKDEIEKIKIYCLGKAGIFHMTFNINKEVFNASFSFSASCETSSGKEEAENFLNRFKNYAVIGSGELGKVIITFPFTAGLGMLLGKLAARFFESKILLIGGTLLFAFLVSYVYIKIFGKSVNEKILSGKKAVQIWTQENLQEYERTNRKRSIYRLAFGIGGFLLWAFLMGIL